MASPIFLFAFSQSFLFSLSRFLTLTLTNSQVHTHIHTVTLTHTYSHTSSLRPVQFLRSTKRISRTLTHTHTLTHSFNLTDIITSTLILFSKTPTHTFTSMITSEKCIKVRQMMKAHPVLFRNNWKYPLNEIPKEVGLSSSYLHHTFLLASHTVSPSFIQINSFFALSIFRLSLSHFPALLFLPLFFTFSLSLLFMSAYPSVIDIWAHALLKEGCQCLNILPSSRQQSPLIVSVCLSRV